MDAPRCSCRARPGHGAVALLILAEPVEPAAPEPSQAEPGVGVVGRAQSRAGRPGRSTARPGAPAVQAPEQRLRAGPARVAHQAPAHGSPQPGGWDSIGGESTGSSSKSRACQELGSLTARSSKNCISESCILRVPNPPPRVGSSSESWILQELDPPRTGSSEHQILL